MRRLLDVKKLRVWGYDMFNGRGEQLVELELPRSGKGCGGMPLVSGRVEFASRYVRSDGRLVGLWCWSRTVLVRRRGFLRVTRTRRWWGNDFWGVQHEGA